MSQEKVTVFSIQFMFMSSIHMEKCEDCSILMPLPINWLKISGRHYKLIINLTILFVNAYQF